MLRPFFSFYGSKWLKVPTMYPKPNRGTIVEPFAGSASFAVRHFEKKVVLVEKDPVIASLWEYLIRATPKQIMNIPLLKQGQSVDDMDVDCLAERHLVGFWIAKACSSPRKKPTKWMREEIKHSDQFWGEKIRRRIASQVEHIKHWEVIEGDYRESGGIKDATFFIDPPYVNKGKYYKHRLKEEDYDRLAEWCLGLHGQIMVCENDGANWLPFNPLGDFRAQRRGSKSKEVLYYRDMK
jgi:site-specific DNA-adenine methylase